MTSESSDGTGGNDSGSGNDGNDVNQMTPELARTLASHAKQKGVGPRRPWDGMKPEAKPEHRFTLRLNDYDRAIAHYVAGTRGKSVQNALITLLREAAKADIKKREGVDSGITTAKETG